MAVRENSMKAVQFTIVSVYLLLASSSLLAQTSSDMRLQKLEETVRLLERRVDSLEAQLRERSAPTPVAADKANWRKLKQGMSESDVEQLLGSPTKVDAFGNFTIWHYGFAEVQFNSRHAVEGWHEP